MRVLKKHSPIQSLLKFSKKSGKKSLDVKNDGEEKCKDDKVEELLEEMSRKLNEIQANQERVECNMKASLENLKWEIIDEIQGSVSNRDCR